MKRLFLLACFPLLVQAAPLEQSLDALIRARYQPTLPGVAALVVKDGKPVLRKAYGLANVELGVPARPEHVFRIGSTTKLFTATAVMMLVEDGKVALDAPLSRYLPNTPKHWEQVTVEHLLTHTSGIPSMTLESGFWRLRAPLDHTLDELIAPVVDKPLQFPSGTAFSYNNTGYILLAMLIEKISGQEFFAFIDSRIAKPLGLKHTRSGDTKALIPGLVTGYRQGPSPALFISNSNLHAAGGLVSTVDDLAVFMQALQSGKLVSPAIVKRMNTSYRLPNGEATGYGLGTWLRTVNGHRLVGHGGYILNFYSELEMDVDANIVAVTLHNGDRFGGDNEYLSKRLIAVAQGKPLGEPLSVTLSPAQYERLAGRYGDTTLRYEAGTLSWQSGEAVPRALTPMSETSFFVPDSEFRLRFKIENGRAKSMQQYEDGGDARRSQPRSED
jgi:D-alanyl-D-alanine carboxypeptidase